MKKMEKEQDGEAQRLLEQTKENFKREKAHIIQQEVMNVYRYRYSSIDFDTPCRVGKYIVSDKHRQFLIEFLAENEVLKEVIQEFQGSSRFRLGGEVDPFGYTRKAMNVTLYGLPKPVQGHIIPPGVAIGNPETATTFVEEWIPEGGLKNHLDTSIARRTNGWVL
jgi:hypothetical protein